METLEQIALLPFAILEDELKDLHRFHECVMDDEGYDVPKERMRRLAEIGLVRRVTANYYEHTVFGLAVINGEFSRRLVAELAKQKPWEGSENWEQLAYRLCAEEQGEECCNELIWEGYPPEPWGERWLKYEFEAKRMIQMVEKFATPIPTPEDVRDAARYRWLRDQTTAFPDGYRDINAVMFRESFNESQSDESLFGEDLDRALDDVLSAMTAAPGEKK